MYYIYLMAKSFSKAIVNPTNKLFKKTSGDVNKFFRKDGQFTKGVGAVASGLGTVGRLVGQGASVGNQIVNAVSKSPYGAVLAPELAVAKGALGVAKMASNTANAGSHSLKDVVSGKSAGHIAGNVLERAKNLEKESNTIKFA